MGRQMFYGLSALVLALILLVGGWAAYRLKAEPPLPPLTVVVPNTPVLDAPESGMRVFHLGHSLVNRDMPAMLAQLAHAAGLPEHDYNLQLGWGATLRAHYEPEVEVPGFASENDTPRFRSVHEAVASGEYDAVVLTEMVELRDAIRWHDGPVYLQRWVQAIRAVRPDTRVFLYESWHARQDTESWLARLDNDPAELWQGRLLAQIWGDRRAGSVHVIPAGRVLAAFTRALADVGGLPGMADETALFARLPDGSLDEVHMNDMGNYLVALTHFAVLYQRPPLGLPHALTRADGTPADPPAPDVAELMQRIVWDTVSQLPVTGLPQEATP
ncbi:MAG: hypothetical protein JJU19_05150 [Pararhodobacter sp.]|nr:hypothetical protein [Pararhodobacter sp.]